MVRVAVWSIVILLLESALSSTSMPVHAGQAPVSSVSVDSQAGRDLYTTYCARCHGLGGKGDGAVAFALKVPPTDLTTLARRNSGRYPASVVEATLNGTRRLSLTTAHGTVDMPIWGPFFRQSDAKDTATNMRIQNLVKYLESIQVP